MPLEDAAAAAAAGAAVAAPAAAVTALRLTRERNMIRTDAASRCTVRGCGEVAGERGVGDGERRKESSLTGARSASQVTTPHTTRVSLVSSGWTLPVGVHLCLLSAAAALRVLPPVQLLARRSVFDFDRRCSSSTPAEWQPPSTDAHQPSLMTPLHAIAPPRPSSFVLWIASTRNVFSRLVAPLDGVHRAVSARACIRERFASSAVSELRYPLRAAHES